MSAEERRRQLEVARRARAQAETEAILGLTLDLRILARGLSDRAGRDPDAAVRAVDRMTSALRVLREPLEAERHAQRDDQPGAARAYAAAHRILCAHAEEDGQGMHWLEPGETCDRDRAPDLADSPGMRQLQAYLDQADAREASEQGNQDPPVGPQRTAGRHPSATPQPGIQAGG